MRREIQRKSFTATTPIAKCGGRCSESFTATKPIAKCGGRCSERASQQQHQLPNVEEDTEKELHSNNTNCQITNVPSPGGERQKSQLHDGTTYAG
eukprot:364557-Chlamydomonas_euryale.AAC.17